MQQHITAPRVALGVRKHTHMDPSLGTLGPQKSRHSRHGWSIEDRLAYKKHKMPTQEPQDGCLALHTLGSHVSRRPPLPPGPLQLACAFTGARTHIASVGKRASIFMISGCWATAKVQACFVPKHAAAGRQMQPAASTHTMQPRYLRYVQKPALVCVGVCVWGGGGNLVRQGVWDRFVRLHRSG